MNGSYPVCPVVFVPCVAASIVVTGACGTAFKTAGCALGALAVAPTAACTLPGKCLQVTGSGLEALGQSSSQVICQIASCFDKVGADCNEDNPCMPSSCSRNSRIYENYAYISKKLPTIQTMGR